MEKNFTWNDEIPVTESQEYVVLPPGEYWFRVSSHELSVWDHGKLNGCKVAKLNLTLWNETLKATAKVNLTLSEKTMFHVWNFWAACGNADALERRPFVPPWGMLNGQTGRCTVKNRTYEDKDGNALKANEIDRWLPPSGDLPPDMPATIRRVDDSMDIPDF